MKKSWRLGLSFFFLGLLLSYFTHHSPAPEDVKNLGYAFPAFLIFLLFISAAASLGAYLRQGIQLIPFSGAEGGLFDLATGTVLLYVLSYTLTLIHCFSSSLSVVLWAILAIFFALGAQLVKPARWFEFANDKWSKLLLFVPFFIVALRLLEGLQTHLHGDAYVTYLPAPRIWATTGGFHDFLRFSQFFLSTSWESLYAWGTALMGLNGGAGLDLTQAFSQWCTGGLALTGIILATVALCQRMAQVFPVQEKWFPVVAIYALQIPVLRWTANLAKHDMGVAFWGMSAFYFTLFLAPVSPLLAFLSGLITGAAVIGKLTVVILGVCLSLQILIFSRKRFLYFCLGGITGGLPVFLRNYFLTQNPVFPWLNNLFPGELLSKAQAEATLHPTAQALGVEHVFSYLQEIHDQILLWPVLILVLIVTARRKDFLKFIWIPVLAILLFTISFRPSTEIRYQNANLVILAAIICFGVFYLLQKLPKKVAPTASGIFALAIIGTANIPSFSLFQIGSSKYATIATRLPELTGGEGKMWIRKNLKPTDSILAMGDPHVYYTLDFHVDELNQTPEWDNRFGAENVEAFTQDLMQSDYHYVYVSTDVPYWLQLARGKELLANLNAKDPACRIFHGKNAEIWNLKCLK